MLLYASLGFSFLVLVSVPLPLSLPVPVLFSVKFRTTLMAAAVAAAYVGGRSRDVAVSMSGIITPSLEMAGIIGAVGWTISISISPRKAGPIASASFSCRRLMIFHKQYPKPTSASIMAKIVPIAIPATSDDVYSSSSGHRYIGHGGGIGRNLPGMKQCSDALQSTILQLFCCIFNFFLKNFFLSLLMSWSTLKFFYSFPFDGKKNAGIIKVRNR